MKTKKSKTHVATKIALCRRLEVSRMTLDKYLSMPGAPEREPVGYNLERVVAFIAENAAAESTRAKASDSIHSLKARELSLKCDRLKFKLEQEQGHWVRKAQVAGAVLRIFGPARAMLEQRLVQEWPAAVVGLSIEEARVKSRELMDKVLEALQKFGAEFDTAEDSPAEPQPTPEGAS